MLKRNEVKPSDRIGHLHTWRSDAIGEICDDEASGFLSQ